MYLPSGARAPSLHGFDRRVLYVLREGGPADTPEEIAKRLPGVPTEVRVEQVRQAIIRLIRCGCVALPN